jgi:predicted lipoprotein with Yx(FWY)xxD motif
MGSIIVGRRAGLAALAVGGLLTLAACGSSTPGGAYGGAATTTPPAAAAQNAPATSAPAAANAGGAYKAPAGAADGSAAAPASGVVLSTGSSSIGTIIVDSHGMTVYEFGKDTMGATTSACTGGCAALWPEVHAGTGTPQVSGVTGTVGTITGVDGQKQVTLNGWPLYTFVHDKAPGDTTGQNFMNLWWALTPSGAHVG